MRMLLVAVLFGVYVAVGAAVFGYFFAKGAQSAMECAPPSMVYST